MDSKKICFLMLVGLSIVSFTDAHISTIFSNVLCSSKCGTLTIRCYAAAGLNMVSFTSKVRSSTPALEMCNQAHDECISKCKTPKPTSNSPTLYGDCGPYKNNNGT